MGWKHYENHYERWVCGTLAKVAFSHCQYGGIRPLAFQLMTSDSMGCCCSFLRSSSGSWSTHMEETDRVARCKSELGGGVVWLLETGSGSGMQKFWKCTELTEQDGLTGLEFLTSCCALAGGAQEELWSVGPVSARSYIASALRCLWPSLWITVHSKGSSLRAQRARRPVLWLEMGIFLRPKRGLWSVTITNGCL